MAPPVLMMEGQGAEEEGPNTNACCPHVCLPPIMAHVASLAHLRGKERVGPLGAVHQVVFIHPWWTHASCICGDKGQEINFDLTLMQDSCWNKANPQNSYLEATHTFQGTFQCHPIQCAIQVSHLQGSGALPHR